MVIANGYILIWSPNHLHANTSGMVYEHVLAAEEKLGRLLKKEEVVHHINHIRNDNNPDNLMVFATKNDHTRFHMLHEDLNMCHLQNDGAYRCEEKLNRCKRCGTIISKKASLCVDCYNISRKNEAYQNFKISREKLKENIRTQSFVSIGKQFGVTDNAIRKWCKLYNLPYRSSDIKKMSNEEWSLL